MTRALAVSVAMAVIGILALAIPRAHAHPLELGVLVVREDRDGTIGTAFRFSGTEAQTTGAEPVLPARCRAVGVASERALAAGGIERHARFDCGPGGLAGETIAVRGMEGTGVQIVVRVERADGTEVGALLDDARREVAFSGDRGAGPLLEHVALGIEHIAVGIDHLLFVLALVLLVRGARSLFATITAFTIGHSVTLALAALGGLHLPSAPVEACIALSVLVVALEAHADRPDADRPDADREAKRPWMMAGAFGLLHGLGFAGALAERGLPRGAIVAALVGFNVGVELGQIAFVAIVLATIVLGRALRVPPDAARASSLVAIGAIAAYFLFDRCTMLGSPS